MYQSHYTCQNQCLLFYAYNIGLNFLPFFRLIYFPRTSLPYFPLFTLFYFQRPLLLYLCQLYKIWCLSVIYSLKLNLKTKSTKKPKSIKRPPNIIHLLNILPILSGICPNFSLMLGFWPEPSWTLFQIG